MYVCRGSKTALAQIAKPPELPFMALRGMEFAKSWLDGTLTEDELTNTATVTAMIAIITVCTTLFVVCTLPSMHAVLWFCIFGAACIGMSRRVIWLENIGAMEFVNADCYFHAMSAIQKLGIQVWPSPDVMLFMGEEDTRSKVDMLSIGVEDSLPHCTVEEFAAGFKKMLAFETCASKQHGGSSGKGIDPDHQAESWPPLHFTPREGVHGPEGRAVQGGHVEQWREGHARYYTVKEIAAGFMKTLDFHTCAIKQNRGSSGECICIIERKAGNYCTSFVVRVLMDEEDTLSKVAMLSVGVDDTLAHYTAEEFAAGFTKTLASRVLHD